MHCGTSGRTPPRRPAFVGRLILLVVISFLALGIWAGPALSTPCAPQEGTRTLAGHVGTGEKQCQPSMPFQKRGNADPTSLAVFIGTVVAVLLLPVAFRRREDLPPE